MPTLADFFHYLVEENDWGRITVRIGDKGPIVTEGNYLVKWPDGFIEEKKVSMEPRSGAINDMGHDYHFTTEVPVIEINHHGAKVNIDLFGSHLRVMRPA